MVNPLELRQRTRAADRVRPAQRQIFEGPAPGHRGSRNVLHRAVHTESPGRSQLHERLRMPHPRGVEALVRRQGTDAHKAGRRLRGRGMPKHYQLQRGREEHEPSTMRPITVL